MVAKKEGEGGNHLNPSTSVDIPSMVSTLNPLVATYPVDSVSPLHSLPQSRTWMGNPFAEPEEIRTVTSPTFHNPVNLAASLSAPQVNPFYQNVLQPQFRQGVSSPNPVLSPSPMLSPTGLFPTNDLFNQPSSSLSQSLETYSIHLLRTQLDQAQQQAQVIIIKH